MSEVVPFPRKKIVPQKKFARRVKGADVWAMRDRLHSEHSPEDVAAKVHAVCPRLKLNAEEPRCLGCPEFEMDEDYGKMQRMCYGLAEEAVAIALYTASAEETQECTPTTNGKV